MKQQFKMGDNIYDEVTTKTNEEIEDIISYVGMDSRFLQQMMKKNTQNLGIGGSTIRSKYTTKEKPDGFVLLRWRIIF